MLHVSRIEMAEKGELYRTRLLSTRVEVDVEVEVEVEVELMPEKGGNNGVCGFAWSYWYV
jgi:hypothetical protein